MKKKNVTPMTVSWSGFLGANVDLYRNGTRIATPTNSGSYIESLKGSGSVTYEVCETGTTNCALAGTTF